MIRLLLTCPEGLSLDQLTDEQQAAVNSVFAQYVLPMPGTITYNNTVIIDAVVNDSFNADRVAELGLPFTIIATWQWDGVNDLVTIKPVDSTLANHLPDGIAGLTHSWAGWPEIS